jgi:hypothetical protein
MSQSAASAVKAVKAVNTNKEQSRFEKVSMNLTKEDIENIEFITNRLNARQQVASVSRSLKLTRELIDLIDSNQKLLVEDVNGNLERIRFIL